jgi:hypothetical protein
MAYGCRMRALKNAIFFLAAILMVGQPVFFAVNVALGVDRASAATTDWGTVVICTSHGAIAVPDEQGSPPAPTRQQNPDCPYCALSCAGLSKLFVAKSTVEYCSPERLIEVIVEPIEPDDVPRQRLRLLTSPPRAPPIHG